tara:strand:- start:64 stop:537 length:474 start_codon:yes stop_codon:yes gene_type:complete
MGLDMYLHGEVTFYSHIHENKNGKFVSGPNPKYTELLKFCDQKVTGDHWGYIQVNIPVMEWRKSNQIHKWFVDECQNGVDECQYTSLSAEKLQELVAAIGEALEHKDSTVLPPQSGIFFGSTDIDDWYWDELQRTYLTLKEVLDAERFKYFTYHSSW